MSELTFKSNALSINNQFLEGKDIYSMKITNMTLDESIIFNISKGNSKQLDIDNNYYSQPGIYKAEIENECFFFKVDGIYNILIKEKFWPDRVLVYIKPDITLEKGKLYFRIEGKTFYFTFPKIEKKEERYFAFKNPEKDAKITYYFKTTSTDEGYTSENINLEESTNEYGIVNIIRK